MFGPSVGRPRVVGSTYGAQHLPHRGCSVSTCAQPPLFGATETNASAHRGVLICALLMLGMAVGAAADELLCAALGSSRLRCKIGGTSLPSARACAAHGRHRLPRPSQTVCKLHESEPLAPQPRWCDSRCEQQYNRMVVLTCITSCCRCRCRSRRSCSSGVSVASASAAVFRLFLCFVFFFGLACSFFRSDGFCSTSDGPSRAAASHTGA